MRSKTPDQIVVPAVKFATDEAGQQVITNVKAQYDQALVYAASQFTQANQCQADIDASISEVETKRREIHELEGQIEQSYQMKRQCEGQGQHARDVAKGAADMLALAGAPVPPPDGELSHNPGRGLANIEAAHNEYNAEAPERAL